jgi:hypothetical protein
MDADDLQPASADIFETMRNVGGANNDVAGRAARLIIANRELGLPLSNHPGLGIRMNMQLRAAAGSASTTKSDTSLPK